jgi:hypothetical protein
VSLQKIMQKVRARSMVSHDQERGASVGRFHRMSPPSLPEAA